MKKIVVFTGAGISQESGLPTYRDSDGLWNNHKIEEVATIAAWLQNPQKMLDFYNDMRHQLIPLQPNAAHQTLVDMEKDFEIQIITQNVDDLHEKAGSKNVLHLHGQLIHRCNASKTEIYPWPENHMIKLGDHAPDGSQIRPHIVWFGEEVPNMALAYDHVVTADILMVIGTSLEVYPAANIIDFLPPGRQLIIIDPNLKAKHQFPAQKITIYTEKASTGVLKAYNELVK